MMAMMMEAHSFGFPFPWWLMLPLFWFVILPAVKHRDRRRHDWPTSPRHGAPDQYTATLPATKPGEDQALAVLRERYARGEIDHAEYEQRRAILLHTNTNATNAPKPAPATPPQANSEPWPY